MTRRKLALALLASALGCAGAPTGPGSAASRKPQSERAAKAPAPAKNGGAKGAAASGATSAPPPSAADEQGIPPKAQRLFEEAVRAEDEQKKLKVPPDWPYLERKWRAVLDAAEVAEARFNLGVALDGQGRLDDARAEYVRAREVKPGLRQAAVNLGVLLERQGDVAGASEAYAQAVRDFPEDAVSRARLAALYRQAGQLDDAWRLAREALVREPRTVGAYRVLARVALQRNELDLAKLVALRAQKLDAKDPELPWVVGQVLARQGDDAGSQAQLRKALALRDGFLPARYALLDGALKKRAWGAVAEHAAAILKVEPQNAQVQLAHGLALRYTGKPDEALQAYDRAEKAAGDRLAEVHLARGVLLARVKSECAPALEELKVYTSRAGPVLPEGSQVSKLQRDCETQLEESRKAAEAAKQMQQEAAKKKAEPAKDAAPVKDSAPGKSPSR
ncbi:MAG TPA: adventurous gliding motility TPR repeat lipoprotein GltE [Anaeromyxobacter sp.]